MRTPKIRPHDGVMKTVGWNSAGTSLRTDARNSSLRSNIDQTRLMSGKGKFIASPGSAGAACVLMSSARRDVMLEVTSVVNHAQEPEPRAQRKCVDVAQAGFDERESHVRLGVTMVLHTWSQTLLEHYLWASSHR